MKKAEEHTVVAQLLNILHFGICGTDILLEERLPEHSFSWPIAKILLEERCRQIELSIPGISYGTCLALRPLASPWLVMCHQVCVVCYVLPGTRYVLCVMCYVLRGAVVRDAWCVVILFHALLRPLNCGPRATYLVRVFDGVCCRHHTRY